MTERSKRDVVADVWSMLRECRDYGWDDGGAEPAAPASAKRATALIRSMPGSLPLPDVGVDPDGSVMFDWPVAHGRSLVLSVDAVGTIPYAWIDNGTSGHGVTPFDGTGFPPPLMKRIAAP